MKLFNLKIYDFVNFGTKWQIKVFFTILAFAIIISVISFTQSIVNELIDREQNIIQFYGKIYENYSNFEEKDPEDLLFLIDEIAPTINFPFVMTDPEGVPYEPFDQWSMNIEFKKKSTMDERRDKMNRIISEMEKNYSPVIVRDQEGKILNKLYYTHSALVDKLRFFPAVAIAIIAIFFVTAYLAFSTSRRNEQSKVWVGMAKEAAHQLGTPLSSLLAWMEILKYSTDDPESIDETISEMENDINRLNTITTRFSKIGSKPEMETVKISNLLESVCKYFEKRLPHLGKKVDIERSFTESIPADVNPELFAWVIENLLKNAAESIENKKGNIHIYMRIIPDKRIYIYVKDNGKGMTNKTKRQIFHPGFTTKKRGWGLGLSLTKRIIEEYHDGKIYVKESEPGEGTTFVIEIPFSKYVYQ